MLKNYLKIGWRTLMKEKTFTALNVIGLSVAFGVAILLAMAAFFDLSYDRFHENADRIFLTYNVQQTAKGPEAGTTQPAPFAEALKLEVPGIEKITRYLQDDALTFYANKEINLDGVWVDADFFSMFTFPVVSGDSDDPLQDLSSVVLTETAATKIFGRQEVVGQTVNVMINGKQEPFSVAAVVADSPNESSLEFDMALRFETNAEFRATKDTWDAQYNDVYVQLQQDVSVREFEKNSHGFTNLHYAEAIENLKRDGAVADAEGQYRRLEMVPLKDIHFTNAAKGYVETSRTVPYLVFGVAFLILLIACVNFINMSIAKSSQRLREIGMRKTLGAQKKHLFFQFWSESLFVFTASLGIGILLSILLLDNFKTIFNTDVSLQMWASPWVILVFLALVFLITLLVGGYPAILLSRLGTIQSLKGKLENTGSNLVRNTLMVMVVQFGIAIVLISGTLVLWGQVDFMRNKDLGYDKEQVLSFPLDGKKNSYEAVQLLREELNGNPDILGITASDNNLGMGRDGSRYSSIWGFEYKGRIVKTNGLIVDYDYPETLGLELVAGRSFDAARPGDTQTVIINESMAKELGEANPLNASLPVGDSLAYPVIGVVKDYNFQDLDKAIEPLTFFLNRDLGLYYAFVKVAPRNMSGSFDAIESAYKKIEPNAEFLGSFLNENVDRTFKREKTMATMITSGSIIAIALSCIGLFAMSLLIVTQRTKEIGVRKVLGASVASITVLLTKDFLKLVLVAFLVASPIAWWFAGQWLENYAYSIDLSLWFFIAAGALAIVIAIMTVGGRTILAAMRSPVKSLRTE